MLQVIKYYMTYRYGLVLVFAMLALIILTTLITGREISFSMGMLSAGLMMPYLIIFNGLWKKDKFDSIIYDLPLSFIKMNVAKFTSFYIYYAVYAAGILAIGAVQGINMLDLSIDILEGFSFIYFIISMFGKVIYLTDKKTILIIPNLIYICAAVSAFMYYAGDNSEIYSQMGIESKTTVIILHNLAVLLLFTALDFFTMYLNRNKLSVA